MKRESHSGALFSPLLIELQEYVERAKLPEKGNNALASVEFSAEGLQALGLFILRSDVWGCLVIGIIEMEKSLSRRPRGRPSVPEVQSLDARRAFRLWETVRNLRDWEASHDVAPTSWTNRRLIEMQRRLEPILFRDEPDEILFPLSVSLETLEQSVSKGRRALQIDANWRSAVCDKIREL